MRSFIGAHFLFLEDVCHVRIKHKKSTKSISFALAIFLIFFVTLTGCNNQSQDNENPIIIPPYENQFADVSYNDCTYILNKNTHKFHYKHCYTIDRMSPKNKIFCNDSRESIIENNYIPCMKCMP